MHASTRAIEFMGVRLTPMDVGGLLAVLDETTAQPGTRIVANHNLHSITLLHRDPKMHRFYELAEWCFIDGMGVIALARLFGHRVSRAERITAVDWLRPLLRHCSIRGYRVFFLGSRPGVAAKAARILQDEIPGLQVEVAHGHFDVNCPTENEAVLTALRRFRPHVLIVGMGMPRQEHWIVDHLAEIDVCAVLNQGGFLDYVAGTMFTPPRWMGRVGLEWLGRLIAEPTRLAGRYLVEPWSLALLVAREWMRHRRARAAS
jgi:N-acetylglucosaminyldiphosphoundecaprenol N-acetyl-beta-D-mannosaminyltransferase